MDLEMQIRRMAASGSSKAEVCRILGVSYPKLYTICDHIDGVVWKKAKNVGNVNPTEDTVKVLNANIAKARAKKSEMALKTVRGVTGNVQQLCDHFKVEISYSSVNRRVASGMTLEEAMFTSRLIKLPKVSMRVRSSASRQRVAMAECRA
jgi:hypothetical protein